MHTLVQIVSSSFSGSTWLGVVLGSHERGFALGIPHRLWEIGPSNWSKACHLHGDQCSLWPEFANHYDLHQNFYIQLAAYLDKDFIVMNNPRGYAVPLKDSFSPEFNTKTIILIRDLRSLFASYLRKNENVSNADALSTFIYHCAEGWDHLVRQFPEHLLLHYEGVVSDPKKALRDIGDYVGFTFDNRLLRYWEHEHHLTGGNPGARSLVAMAQGGKAETFPGREFYEREFIRIVGNEESIFNDHRWEAELSRADRALFDLYRGLRNERWGYERDRFSDDELRAALASFPDQDERRRLTDGVEEDVDPRPLRDIESKRFQKILEAGWPVGRRQWDVLLDADRDGSFELFVGEDGTRGPKVYEAHLVERGFKGLGTVLDAGCGFGHLTTAMARLNDRAIGVDSSAARLGVAFSLADGAGLANMSVQRAELERLPFADQSFDGVHCYNVVSFLDARKVLRELQRVLRPGGRLYIDINSFGWFCFLLINRVVVGEGGRRRYWLRVLARFLWHRVVRRHDNYFVSERRFCAILEDIGFRILSVSARRDRKIELLPDGTTTCGGPDAFFWGLPRVLEAVAERRP